MKRSKINSKKSSLGLNCNRNYRLKGALLAMLALWVFALPARAALYSGGGTAEDPFIIDTPAKLNDIGLNTGDWGGHFKLTADINIAAYTGESYNIIGYGVLGPGDIPFTGVFDGNGHAISNFTYTSPAKDYLGLFGYVDGEEAQIKNLGLINANVDAGTGGGVGALVGFIYHGDVTNCFVRGGSVRAADTVGGLVGIHSGKNASGSISNCYATCNVSGDMSVGGLVGGHGGITPTTVEILNCRATGSVSGTSTRIGGLVGCNNALIFNSHASGSVSSQAISVGGLVGYNGGSVPYLAIISNCSASGQVGTSNMIGGLVGWNRGTIYQSCAMGDVSGEVGIQPYWIGGLVGYNQAGDYGGDFGDANGIISESYATGNVTGHSELGGLVAKNDGGDISRCYAMGSVTGSAPWGASETAGLVGLQVSGGTITKCYSTGRVSWGFPQNGGGGLVGDNVSGTVRHSFWDSQTSGWSASDGGVGKTTVQMKTRGTFTSGGWDFLDETANGTEDIWRLCVDLTSYPMLAWERWRLGDYCCPDGSDFKDYAVLAWQWQQDPGEPSADIAPECGDGIVNGLDLNVLCDNWLAGVE